MPFVTSAGGAFASKWKAPAAAALLTFAITLTVYVLTVAPDITWEYYGADGGELIAAAVTHGVPHPPGYPLYMLLGKIAALLPLGTVAFRFNLLSAVFMAIAAALLAGVTTGMAQETASGAGADRRRPDALAPGLFAGTAFAFTPLVWQQALIAEVYALNTVMIGGLLCFIFWRQAGRVPAFALGLTQGLALTTHLTSVLLLPLALLATGVMDKGRLSRFALGLAVGLTPFLLAPLSALTNSPIVWGAPHTLHGWWWLVTAEVYQPNQFSFPVTRWAERAAEWVREPSLWVVALLLLFFFARFRTVPQRARRQAAAAALITVLYLVYAFTYDAPGALVLTLPAVAISCLLAGAVMGRIRPWYLVLPLALLVLNFQRIDLREHVETRSLAESTLREAPPDSIVLTTGDHATFTLWYLQYVEGQREDIVIVDQNLLAFDWYRLRLAAMNSELLGLATYDIDQFKALNGPRRPWCELEFAMYTVETFYCVKEPT